MEHSEESHGQREKVPDSSFYTLILGDIRQAIRDGREDEYEHLRRCIVDASKQWDLIDREANVLLRTLDILKVKDEEVRLKLMLELTPDLLSPYERRQAELGHQFRLANGRERICFFLQANAHSLCAECMKSTQDGCTEQCPARRTETPVSAQVMQQEPVLA
ncbi:MAG: hypothetical protein Q7S29_02845 [Candidatus Peribacter sp.]|nr:hypothetical protein [Candidatus Peribacter sp.]